jgi:hypothetical protein
VFFANIALFAATDSALDDDDRLEGSAGHSSIPNSGCFPWTEFGDNSRVVDGKAILNDRGTKCPPRSLTQEFMITASPNVCGGETHCFGKGSLQGFN